MLTGLKAALNNRRMLNTIKPTVLARVAVGIAIISTLILALGLGAGNEGDVAWYQWMIHDWMAGHLPYVTHPVEYPPMLWESFFFRG